MRSFLSLSFLMSWANAIDPTSISYSSSRSNTEDDSVESLSSQQHAYHHQRHLEAIGGCAFEELVSLSSTCSISMYCKTTSPSTFIECGGDLTNRWVIRLEETRPRCYNNPNDRVNYFFPDSSTVLQEGAYCSRTTLTFNFVSGSVLTSVESSEVFTAPEKYSQKTLLSVLSVQPCDSNADWTTFGSQPYCYVQCPQELFVDGESCQVACLDCDGSGRQSFSCPNFYPYFGYNCFDTELNNFQSEALAFFNQGDATFTPTAAPVPVIVPTLEPTPPPTEPPVPAPTHPPTAAPQTAPPTTPTETPPPTGEPTLAQTTAETDSPSQSQSQLQSPKPSQSPTSSPTLLKEESTQPVAPPVKRTEAPVVIESQAPTAETSFFVEGPIALSPVFLSSDATIWSNWLSCTLVSWLIVVFAC